ncbi:hypothetical protein JTE90_012561 [Oedothorax gibbosus]|uniref:C2H2-type domain-containing protein n=1 Tax=Oedothorax gibbosus TaxID=931172 RepID=A0AAV6TWP2_9ARAC|nr:hypothetical protein JTE90_012561 [Oedothorax gibbosus]
MPVPQQCKTKTKGDVLQCSLCPYACQFSSIMKRHMVTHTGEKPYACPHCGKRCARKEHLKRHLEVHKKK